MDRIVNLNKPTPDFGMGGPLILDMVKELVLGDVNIYIDIKPADCPNELDEQSKGIVLVAILGANNSDVTQIDPDTLKLEVKRWNIEDVTSPHVCVDGEYSDGYDDLTIKFKTQVIVNALNGNAGEVTLTLTGELKDGRPIEGSDKVIFLKH